MDIKVPEFLQDAFDHNDVEAVRAAFTADPELQSLINQPCGPFETFPICNARSKEMLDLLLEYGADINAKSKWWAGGFCLLDSAEDELARYAIQRGALIEIHAAARLGMIDQMRTLIAEDPTLVNAPGGDGKRPLHFAGSVEVAKILLDHGAEVDAKDIDHESTAAQYQLEDHHDIVRLLIEHGAKTDIFMAAALGDQELVEFHLKKDPGALSQRVDSETFPMSDSRAGGSIYFWTLGRDYSPHQVASKFKHQNLLEYLFSRSSSVIKLINYCLLHDEIALKALLGKSLGLTKQILESDCRALPNAARDRDHISLRLLLEAGLPINTRGQHNATSLHWAAWHGDLEAVELLLKYNPSLELADNEFQITPLQWAMHGSENSWCYREGNYPETARRLLNAGAEFPEKISGSSEIQNAIKGYLDCSNSA